MTTTSDLITDLFCRVDDRMRGIPKHPEAHLWPSEVGTLGLLHALKGEGNRAFYRWRSCPCSLRLNTRGLRGDRHRSKEVPSIGPS
jgi:hypothetical protein